MEDKVTRTGAILAHCHQCMGYYQDGKEDCQTLGCPLYPFMPYRKLDPDLTWNKYNPKRSGQVTWEDSKREIDDATREALVERMSKAREARAQTDVDDEEEDE